MVMTVKTMVAVLVFALSGMALTQPAYAGCGGKVIRKARCKSDGTIKFVVCGSFGGPVEVFLNDCLVTTVTSGERHSFQRKIRIVGFGPGEYRIKGVNSRGVIKEKTVVCPG